VLGTDWPDGSRAQYLPRSFWGDAHEESGCWTTIAVVLLVRLAQPGLEEIYFRGILFVALARWFGDVLSVAAVTPLFWVILGDNTAVSLKIRFAAQSALGPVFNIHF
jgi:membrane protease YdiL (CAAX protease family)